MAFPTTDDADESNTVTGGGSPAPYVVETQAPAEGDKAKIEEDVKALLEEYDEAVEFDKSARQQYAVDRRYAAGTADIAWAVSANLIGSFIDILHSTLYARDPDVSVRKAAQVNESGTVDTETFAKTIELVVSRLWKDARLKKIARKMVRSVLSVGVGWMKVNLLTEKVPQPETEKALNDAKTTLERISGLKATLADPGENLSDDERSNKKLELERQIETLQDKIETSVRKFLAIDFVPAQQMQISLDVQCTEDHLDADWNAHYIFVPTKSLKGKFPTLTVDDLKSAKKYYQKKPRIGTRTETNINSPIGETSAEDADTYTTSGGGDQKASFAKVIELWDRRDMHIKTMIEGVKTWAKAPYNPPYGSSRFYSFFRLSFYEVDDTRHPQSLSFRLAKLMDEYSCSRSNQRLTRERSIPGVMFNAAQVADTEATKLSSSKQQELIGIKLTMPDQPLANAFAAKPIGAYDPRLYDTAPILSDMDRISGVQQAMQQAAASAQPKTATEASIEQAGAASRTGTDRDLLETMMTDLAQYTTECALQSLSIPDVQKIAGPAAFWPANMSIDDITSLVEITIEAGTTGKPRSAADLNAWIQALPMIKEMIPHIQQALARGDKALYDALCAVLRETLTRLGDTVDIDRFIPKAPPPPAPPPPPEVKVSLSGQLTPEAAQELSGAPPPQTPPGASLPAPDGAGGGGPALTHNPSLQVSPTHAPEVHDDHSIHLHVKPPGESNG